MLSIVQFFFYHAVALLLRIKMYIRYYVYESSVIPVSAADDVVKTTSDCVSR